MTATPDSPVATAAFVLLAMSMAGCVHVIWLRSAPARRWLQPIDRGLTWRGKRLLGPNKMLRGLVAMPLAGAVSFGLLAALRDALPNALQQGMWPFSASRYAMLGFFCGLAFMLAELPNSFIKRQFDVPAGLAPQGPVPRVVVAVADRLDSVVGVLLTMSLLAPLAAATWLWLLLLGPGLHALFSLLLHRLGLKARAL